MQQSCSGKQHCPQDTHVFAGRKFYVMNDVTALHFYLGMKQIVAAVGVTECSRINQFVVGPRVQGLISSLSNVSSFSRRSSNDRRQGLFTRIELARVVFTKTELAADGPRSMEVGGDQACYGIYAVKHDGTHVSFLPLCVFSRHPRRA